MIFQLDIADTLAQLLSQEDTDGDKKITIEDKGPKAFNLINQDGKPYTIKGTYYLSNLLQELVIAKREGQTKLQLALSKIEELPVKRISRMIRAYYWEGLTRRMDKQGIQALLADTKNEQLTGSVLNIYVPSGDSLAWNYYQQLSQQLPLQPVGLPKEISPEYVKGLNKSPGILSLKLEQKDNGIEATPFVVPGGRFNEMYGWDSYFESVGLLLDKKVHLAKAMADNFKYEITHYGQILNANRSYYLTRTQPPFYSSLIREVFEHTKDKDWLQAHLKTAIKEYQTVWMVPGERLTDIGLNRFLAKGIGVPPEVEEGHFDAVLTEFAQKHQMSLDAFTKAYDQGSLIDKELDDYFIHDRTVRESGHDTSYRIEGLCAHLVLVELNAMLYKYETDFAYLIKTCFNDSFKADLNTYNADYWLNKASDRKALVDTYLWDETNGFYLDYNIKEQQSHYFESATALVPLWAGMASQEQAAKMVETILPKLKEQGGIASTSKESIQGVDKNQPARQWDYPNGWAPHQMLIWKGLIDYGFTKEAEELIYRWMYMLTKNAVDYNGTIPEKYDVVAASHKVFAEYGNVGTDFEYITTEGFGWMNASFQYGLSLLPVSLIDTLNKLVAPNQLF